MPKTARLTERTDWRDVEFVERERRPREFIEKVFATALQDYHFRIQLFLSMGWVSVGVGQRFTTGCRRLPSSRQAVTARIALRSIRK